MLSNFYPDANPEVATVDGYIGYSLSSSPKSYADIISPASINLFTLKLNDSATPLLVELKADVTANHYWRNMRGYVSFDTSSLQGEGIEVATLRLSTSLGAAVNLGATTLDVVAVNSTTTTSLGSLSLYGSYQSTILGSINLADFTPSSTVDIPLDVSAINKTGLTRLGLVLGYENGTPPTWGDSLTTSIAILTAESGVATRPTLEIEHHTEHQSSPSGNIGVYGSATVSRHSTISPAGTISLFGSVTARKVVQPVAGKEYIYKVYDKDFNYIGIWPDVESELSFSQAINTPGTNTTVRLARSAERSIETRDSRFTQDGDTRLTEDGQTRDAVSVTNSSIGENTDVELNYNVDVYVHYGTFEERLTEDGDVRLLEDGEERTVQVGAPLGRRIFSGYILDYEAEYGERTGVEVTLLSHGAELADAPIKNGTSTTVSYSSTEIADIVKDVVDDNPGNMTYSADSIENTGISVNQVFRLNTKKEGIETVFKQSPSDFYWYGGVDDREVHLHQTSATADHIFVLGKHIGNLKLKRTLEGLKNELYFVGGDTGGGTFLYKTYNDSTSLTNWRRGLDRRTDRRVTTTSYTERYKDKLFGRFSEPIYTTTLRIPAEVYDIETIRIGDTVGFRNFDNFVDELVLQIVNLRYTPYYVELQVGEVLQSQNEILNETQESLQDEQYIDIPDTPS